MKSSFPLICFVLSLAISGCGFGNSGTPKASSHNVNVNFPALNLGFHTYEGDDLFVAEHQMVPTTNQNNFLTLRAQIIGLAKNNTGKNFDSVVIVYNLFDKDNVLIGSASDIKSNIEAGVTWRFRVDVYEKDVATFKVAKVYGMQDKR